MSLDQIMLVQLTCFFLCLTHMFDINNLWSLHNLPWKCPGWLDCSFPSSFFKFNFDVAHLVLPIIESEFMLLEAGISNKEFLCKTLSTYVLHDWIPDALRFQFNTLHFTLIISSIPWLQSTPILVPIIFLCVKQDTPLFVLE